MANELEILISTREITLSGKPVTVREYTLTDSLEHADDIEVMVQAFAERLAKSNAVELHEVRQIIAQHRDCMTRLLAASSGLTAEQVGNLPASDGHELLMWWWLMNAGFFLNVARQQAQLQRQRTGAGTENQTTR